MGQIGETYLSQTEPRNASHCSVRSVAPLSPCSLSPLHPLLTKTSFRSYIDNSNFKEALALINTLLRELKKLDDKMVLTEVHLLESRVNHALVNFPKAKVRFNLPCLLLVSPLVFSYPTKRNATLANRTFDNRIRIAGGSHFSSYGSKLNLLSTIVTSSIGYAIWCLTRRRQGLQNCVRSPFPPLLSSPHSSTPHLATYRETS